jgi:MarR family transcriptional regulator for hemolysin
MNERHARLTSALLMAGRRWRMLAQTTLSELSISEARASALVWISRLGGGVRQITLAGYIGIEGPSLVRLLDELSAAGLVVRREDPADRRAKTVWLTEAGAQLAAKIEHVLSGLREQVFGGLASADIDGALRVFQAVNDASAQPAPTAGTESPGN